jgi:DNA transposition AAA+ family ATPase
MKNNFVKTENVLRLVGALGELKGRGQVVPGLALVHGHQGFGKTEATSWWAVQNFAIYTRAQAAWTVNWMLMDLAAGLGLAPEGISRANFRQVKRELTRFPRPVLLDEADYILRDRRLLDTVRDLHDATNAPFVLVGMAGIREAVARKSPQFWSRVSQEVEFTPLTPRDVQIVAGELAEMQMGEDTAARIQRHTEGNFRQTVVLLSYLETMIRANPQAELPGMVERAAGRLRAAG